jgi:dihydrofolate reductase
MLIAIFAIDEENGMGLNGSMPWPVNKEDMFWFKSTTLNHVVVMGSNTWNSTGMPKPLPNRINIVATRQAPAKFPVETINGDICQNLLTLQEMWPEKNIFVIGGGNLLLQAIPVIEKMYITRIKGKYNCDTKIEINSFLPQFNLTNQMVGETCVIEKYERIS